MAGRGTAGPVGRALSRVVRALGPQQEAATGKGLSAGATGLLGHARGVSTFGSLRSEQNVDGDATMSNGTEDFASKILLEMRGRKGEEVRCIIKFYFLLCVEICFYNRLASE